MRRQMHGSDLERKSNSEITITPEIGRLLTRTATSQRMEQAPLYTPVKISKDIAIAKEACYSSMIFISLPQGVGVLQKSVFQEALEQYLNATEQPDLTKQQDLRLSWPCASCASPCWRCAMHSKPTMLQRELPLAAQMKHCSALQPVRGRQWGDHNHQGHLGVGDVCVGKVVDIALRLRVAHQDDALGQYPVVPRRRSPGGVNPTG